MSGVLSFSELAGQLAAQYPASDQLTLLLAGWEIKVVSNSQRVIAELASYFEPFVAKERSHHLEVTALEAPELATGLDYTLKQPDPGKSRIKEEWADLPGGRVVRKRLTGMVFAFGPGGHLAVGPCLANINQVVNFINNRLIQLELNQGCLLGHAAGVKTSSNGLALAGFSGMGKSTLALHLMSLGTTFVSNDRLLVRQNGGRAKMTGVAKLPRINPGTALNNPDLASVIPPEEREEFAALASDEIWELEHKYDVDIAQCFGSNRFELNSPLDMLAILNWHRDQEGLVFSEVDLDERRDLLAAFKKDWGLFFLNNGREPDHSDQAYLDGLKGVRVFELSGGVDFLGAAKLLMVELERRA